MKPRLIHGAIAAAGVLLACGGAQAATCAKVAGDVRWDVSGTFADGGAVSGCFYVNVYGNADNSAAWSVTTTAVGGFPAYAYDAADTYIGRSGDTYDFGSTKTLNYLQLVFTSALNKPVPDNVIVAATSYECISSYACYLPNVGSNYRYLSTTVGSSAVGFVPEPDAWALLTLGAAFAGGALRRRRGPTLA